VEWISLHIAVATAAIGLGTKIALRLWRIAIFRTSFPSVGFNADVFVVKGYSAAPLLDSKLARL
jgi:hypothetical protein